MLPIEILVYNTLKHSTTKRTLFFINKGFKANISIKIRKCEELVLYIIIIIKDIHRLQNKLRQDLIFFNKNMKKFANKKRVRGLTLKKKNKVYLLWRILNTKIIFIQTTQLSNKLDFAKLEPFRILKVLGLVMYKLNLLDSIKIIRIRYISVLKLANPGVPLMKNIPDINPKSQKKV